MIPIIASPALTVCLADGLEVEQFGDFVAWKRGRFGAQKDECWEVTDAPMKFCEKDEGCRCIAMSSRAAALAAICFSRTGKALARPGTPELAHMVQMERVAQFIAALGIRPPWGWGR